MKYWVTLLVVWGTAFVLAEAIGVAITSILSMTTSDSFAMSLGQAGTIIIRVIILTQFAPAAGISLSNTYRTPLPSRTPLLLVTIVTVGILAYTVNLATSATTPNTIQYTSFIVNGALWTIPFTASYYLSEIVLLTIYTSSQKSRGACWGRRLLQQIFS